MLGRKLTSWRHLLPFKSYFHFRFFGHHLEYRLSANVDQNRPTSGSALSFKSKSDRDVVEIALQSPTVQKLFPHSVLVAAILNRDLTTLSDVSIVQWRNYTAFQTPKCGGGGPQGWGRAQRAFEGPTRLVTVVHTNKTRMIKIM